MKRLIKANDLCIDNINTLIKTLPQDLQKELQYAVDNYSTNRSIYNGEHPASICNKWRNDSTFSKQLDTQQMTNLWQIMEQIKQCDKFK